MSKIRKRLTDLEKTLQPGDIVLYGPKEVKTTGITGAIHRGFNAASARLQGDFLHSGIYIGDGKTIESFAGQGTKEHKFKDIAKDRKITVVRPKLSMKTKLKAVEHAKKMQGKNYSITSLGSSAKNLLLPNKAKGDLKRSKDVSSFNCATLITNAYRKAGAKVVDTDIDVAAPVELASSMKNKMVFVSDQPDESLVITEAGRKASRKAKRFMKQLKVAGSIMHSSSHSESNVNGDISFTGHRVTSNGKTRGLKYRGTKKDGVLSAKLEKMGGAITPAMLEAMGYRANDAYGIAKSFRDAGITTEDFTKSSTKVKNYSREKFKKIKERKAKGLSKTASIQQIYSDSKLKIIAHPEACNWMPSQEVIRKLGHFMHKPMCIRIFPRDMVYEIYDSEHPCPLGPDDYYKFRAYTSGNKATVFVDDTETKESALWVILHELAHMDMKASSYLYKAYCLATPPDYNESDEAHERDPEEQMANMVATKWLGQCGCEEIEYARPWWRARVDAKCSMEKDGSMEKEAANVVALAAGVAAGTVAVYDYFKSRGMESAVKTIEEELAKNQVSAKQYIRKKDPRVKVITKMSEAGPMLKEIKGDSDRDMTKRQLSQFFSKKETNAFAFRGKKGEYIITHPKCNSLTLDHELGHIHDFRSQNIDMTGKHTYNKDPLKQFLFKKNYQEGMYKAEVVAWDRAKVKEDNKLRTAALGTYDKSFHHNRMSVAAPTAVGLLLYGAK